MGGAETRAAGRRRISLAGSEWAVVISSEKLETVAKGFGTEVLLEEDRVRGSFTDDCPCEFFYGRAELVVTYLFRLYFMKGVKV